MGTGFYGSNDSTNSVKALKEDRSKGSGFNPIRSIPPCSHWYNNYAVWNIKTQIHASRNKSTHSEMGPVWQNPNQRTVRTAHLSVLMTMCNSVHNTTQNSSDNLPSYLQTNIIAQMLSIGGEGVPLCIRFGAKIWSSSYISARTDLLSSRTVSLAQLSFLNVVQCWYHC